MTHYILKCECGLILSQCRCPAPDKTTHTSPNPCKHRTNPTAPPPFGETVYKSLTVMRLVYSCNHCSKSYPATTHPFRRLRDMGWRLTKTRDPKPVCDECVQRLIGLEHD